MPTSIVYNQDCLPAMREMPDNCFDLALVDPPYGLGEDGGAQRTRGSKRTNGVKKGWDSRIPELEYFKELFRVSKNQIVWGGNYFTEFLPPSRSWIYWQKDMGGDFADGELAWTSFDRVLKQFKKRSETFNRIHPTQKPVSLYRWILHNYTNPGDKILDTHLGSGSSRIAAYNMGFDFTGFELDSDYYQAQEKRFQLSIQQQSLF